MRKLWYAGAAVAGGMFLFGASPAQADLLPGAAAAEQQADQRLADLLGQSNGVNVSNPLGYSTLGDTAVGRNPLVQFRSGQNSPDLNPLLPGESASAPRPDLPAADVVSGALRKPTRDLGGLPVRQLPLRGLPALNGVVGHGLPLLGGLMPDGLSPAASGWTAEHPEQFDGGVPLLGGLDGMLPANTLPQATTSTDEPDTTGLPLGGITVADPVGLTDASAAKPATATGVPAAGVPGAVAPAAGTSGAAAAPAEQPGSATPAVTPDDPRLHEEPVDGEASHRGFSPNGRPVAGTDTEFR